MIDKEKLFAYFERYHGPIIPSTNGWHEGVCPFCGKNKLAINFNYRIAKCWRGCFKGFAIDMVQKYHGTSYFETHEFIESMDSMAIRIPWRVSAQKTRAIEMDLPRGFVPILFGDTVMGNRARKYLATRKFDLNYLDKIGVGYCTEQEKKVSDDFFGYIIIPFKRNGELAYFIGRNFINGHIRYKNPPREKFDRGKMELFFNEEALQLQSKIYLTEGWACAATLKERGMSMQGSIMSTIQRNIVIKSEVDEVVIIPDAGFYLNGLKMARDLIKHKEIKVLNLNELFNSGFGKDVNEIGRDKVLELEQNTPYMDEKFLIKELFRNGTRSIHTR